MNKVKAGYSDNSLYVSLHLRAAHAKKRTDQSDVNAGLRSVCQSKALADSSNLADAQIKCLMKSLTFWKIHLAFGSKVDSQ